MAKPSPFDFLSGSRSKTSVLSPARPAHAASRPREPEHVVPPASSREEAPARTVLSAEPVVVNTAQVLPLPALETGRAVALRPQHAPRTDEIFSKKSLEKILLGMGVKQSHVDIALNRASETKESLAQIMRDFGFLTGERVAEAVSLQTGFEYFGAEKVDDIKAEDLAGLELTDFKKFVPVGRRPDGTLMVAVPDADTVNAALNSFYQESRAEVVVASEHTIQNVYLKFFANTAEAFDLAVKEYTEKSALSRRQDEDDSTLGLIRTIYFSLLRHACYSGASDLYLYQSEHVGIVRLKVNGVGQIFRTIDISMYKRLLTKMVQDNTKAEELRLRPKETVVEFTDEDKKEHHDIASRFGFRLELAQSRGINSAVIRILDKNSAATDLSRLPFDDQTRKALSRVSRTATGFFLVTGPTGSGKTTSLYALLKDIDAVERSIQSIENPIEYKHGLWLQFEVRKDASNEGDEYNVWLKALLRNAPDVILVGEVRDKEVASICMDAANTGHLVFATLHTNSAVSALARLKALQVDSNLLGASLLGILAQRLVQTLCDACAVPDDTVETHELLADASYLGNMAKNPRRAGRGCPHCNFTGFRGRRMVYELLEMSPAVRELVEQGATPTAVARAGLPESKSMWACGLGLVAQGITSREELERVANKSV
ncbi:MULTISPECIES: GspE/PulE family protein [unclassified Variovorax]|uniref:GspE/PulE family protein n=1 Tax=unclassified Variovorax TaxID=663243 RepID=UPI0013184EC4|nr:MULTISPECIES: ATPase, T2SS/T4P/T4SS family [unclassified Variovorax]VTU41550.1 Type II traffic warden ATPase [Variovorax sp. SRS16]VTU41573.1 Type II traffic warden ATPase [Variovorax sp. PBL-E5]VTU44793.1 Type II traffic warden ATPase [Variovorax sp. PBL-H6]